MHAFRAFLLVVVIFVGISEGLLLEKKGLVKKAVAVKGGLLADLKVAALKIKAGAVLKKAGIVGGFKALGKAKLGLLGGLKAAKLKILGGIAAIKLAKLAALKAGKLVFVKTLAAAKLAPFIAEKLAAKDAFGKIGALKDKDDIFDKSNPLLDGVSGIFGGGGSFLPFGEGGGNPLGSILGDLVLGGLGGGLGGGPRIDFGKILGGLGGLPALIPRPAQPDIRIQTYQVNPPVISSYGPPPAVVTSYGTPIGSPSPSYGHPTTSYGAPY